MGLLQQWKEVAYNQNLDKNQLQALWQSYFDEEKRVYASLLANPKEDIRGSVKELAERFDLSIMNMTGFLDGINESLVEANPIEDMDEDTIVNLNYDVKLLYKNMVDAKADWLYNLEAWNSIFTPEEKDKLYKEAKTMHTVVNERKIGRNEPCTCGSGKKYKHCCGK